MKIKDGGQAEMLINEIETIRISQIEGNITFELWINEKSLSYLTFEELLNFRNEINIELRKYIE